ncbi:MAG: hypothetical protein M1830_004427 [Pleopsidium flavum]|nr:MAG: hypothetical protein M1830_004427 [Pleopsidium flavum]
MDTNDKPTPAEDVPLPTSDGQEDMLKALGLLADESWKNFSPVSFLAAETTTAEDEDATTKLLTCSANQSKLTGREESKAYRE